MLISDTLGHFASLHEEKNGLKGASTQTTVVILGQVGAATVEVKVAPKMLRLRLYTINRN